MFKFIAAMFAALHNIGAIAEMISAKWRIEATKDFSVTVANKEDGAPAFDEKAFNDATAILKQMRK